ncbi:MAG: hypothetical protein Q9175_002306 [Cornicularia normoerica]
MAGLLGRLIAPIMGPVISGLVGGNVGPQPAPATAPAPAPAPAPTAQVAVPATPAQAPQQDQNDQGQGQGGVNLRGQSVGGLRSLALCLLGGIAASLGLLHGPMWYAVQSNNDVNWRRRAEASKLDARTAVMHGAVASTDAVLVERLTHVHRARSRQVKVSNQSRSRYHYIARALYKRVFLCPLVSYFRKEPRMYAVTITLSSNKCAVNNSTVARLM